MSGHHGNVLADPEANRIVFLDLGLMGRLQTEQRVDLLGLVYALKEVDISGIADSVWSVAASCASVAAVRASACLTT